MRSRLVSVFCVCLWVCAWVSQAALTRTRVRRHRSRGSANALERELPLAVDILRAVCAETRAHRGHQIAGNELGAAFCLFFVFLILLILKKTLKLGNNQHWLLKGVIISNLYLCILILHLYSLMLCAL